MKRNKRNPQGSPAPKNQSPHPTRPIFVMDKELSDIFFKIAEVAIAGYEYLDDSKVLAFDPAIKTGHQDDFCNNIESLQSVMIDLLGSIVKDHVYKFSGKAKS